MADWRRPSTHSPHSGTFLQAMGSQPAAQPRNVICGMLLSCAAGVLARTIFGANVIAAAPMAVAGAISTMQATSTVHRELTLPLCVEYHTCCRPHEHIWMTLRWRLAN